MTLAHLRTSVGALLLAVCAWASGCATAPNPMVEPFFASRTYTPARIAVLPPDVFVIYDQVGDNDPVRSAALGQAVAAQSVQVVADALRRRGYDVDLSARWDGIVAGNGALLVSREDLGWLANSFVQFANGPAGGGQGPVKAPSFVAPQLASRVGWATQSDAILYVNMKGVAVSPGKRTAQVIGTVFIVVIVAAIIALMLADGKSSGGGRAPGAGGGGSGRGVGRASGAAPGQGVASGAGSATGATLIPPGHGSRPGGGGGGRVYGGGPSVGFGVGVMVPLNEPVYTHDGTVAEDDENYAGDNLHVSLTLISAHDGRVLWHIRDEVDVDADKPGEIDTFVRRYLDTIPPSLAFKPAPVKPAPVNQ